MTDITELAQRMKAAAEKLGGAQWQTRKGFSGIEVIVKGSFEKGAGCVSFQPVAADLADIKTARAIALFSPGNILTLVEALESKERTIQVLESSYNDQTEALEKAQRANSAQDDHINQQQDRIEQLEKGCQHAAKRINSWRRLAKQNIAEREKDISELEAARGRIAELEPIHAAAEKLVRCKGRYHSEQNYRALAALFGVNAPDLPPLDSESRTVTVKPMRPGHITVGGERIGIYMRDEVDEFLASLAAAGIKVEAE